jgi:molecular chaperone GrpE
MGDHMSGERERDNEWQRDEEHEDGDDLGFKVFDRRFWADEPEAAAEGDEARSDAPAYVEQLEQKVKEKDEKLREYIAAYKREVGEKLEETKRRLERDTEQRIKALRGEFATPMLEVFEALERSLAAARDNADIDTLRQGLDMLAKLMVQKLAALGLERVPTDGALFDPQFHEAVAVAEVSDPNQHNHVVAEFSPGFSCDGRVVRPARVQVGKAT